MKNEKVTADNSSSKIDPQLAEIFARDAEKAIVAIESVIKNNFKTESDIQLYVINIHAMKSALANIGKAASSNTAHTLEQAGRDKDINIMASETQKFLDALRVIIEELRPKEENLNIEDTKETLALLREKLILLKEACESFDKKATKTILNELREKSWSVRIKDMLNSIAEHLLHSEFDTAIALADEFLKSDE
jgi:HPt (histidine-containing phosphotransfer) domain-containing protein